MSRPTGDLAGQVAQGRIATDRHIDLGSEAVSKPPRACIENLTHGRDMFGRVADLVDDARFDAIEHAREHRLGRLPDNGEDGEGDEQTDDRIGEREPEPHAKRRRRRQAGQPVGWA